MAFTDVVQLGLRQHLGAELHGQPADPAARGAGAGLHPRRWQGPRHNGKGRLVCHDLPQGRRLRRVGNADGVPRRGSAPPLPMAVHNEAVPHAAGRCRLERAEPLDRQEGGARHREGAPRELRLCWHDLGRDEPAERGHHEGEAAAGAVVAQRRRRASTLWPNFRVHGPEGPGRHWEADGQDQYLVPRA